MLFAMMTLAFISANHRCLRRKVMGYFLCHSSPCLWGTEGESSQEMLVENDISEVLKKNELFTGLNAQELQSVLAAARERSVEKDGFLFFQGDPAQTLYFLRRGKVRVSQVTPDGQQVLLRIVGAGALVGVVALVENNTYPASTQALEESLALSWSRAELVRLLEKIPRLALNALQFMSGQLQHFQDRYRELATERVERRLARTILRLANQAGKKTPQGVLIDLPLSRQDLAEMSGTTLYTVSRILSQWEGKGLVQVGRERVVITFPHGLVLVADDLLPDRGASPE